MALISQAITGSTQNRPEGIKHDIYEVLQDFYHAFNNTDFALMQENWDNSEEIAMDNPLGGIKRGWDELKEIYQRIFTGQSKVYVEFYDYSIVEFEGGFCAIGRERGTLELKGKKLDLAIRTSRVYKRINGVYKQVHHHGSIEDATLLQTYQDLVR